jgi:hypothetical protein
MQLTCLYLRINRACHERHTFGLIGSPAEGPVTINAHAVRESLYNIHEMGAPGNLTGVSTPKSIEAIV